MDPKGGRRGLGVSTPGPITEQAANGPPATSRDEPLTFLFTDVEGSTRLWDRYRRVGRALNSG